MPRWTTRNALASCTILSSLLGLKVALLAIPLSLRAATLTDPIDYEETVSRQSDMDNHANQLNPDNDAYWESRGYDEYPDDWQDRHDDEDDSAGNRQAEPSRT